MAKRVYLDSIGCRLNQSEIVSMARAFQGRGYNLSENPTEADLMVVNTCAVTNQAGKESRKLVRQLNRQNPEAEIAVTGCYAQIAPETVAKLRGVAAVVDNFSKDQLVPMVTGDEFEREPLERSYQPGVGGHTRAFVKVQDGCDNACTFCVTTIARGAGRSRPFEDVIQEVKLLARGGYQEAVLTGVHLGSYGHDLGNLDGLRDLVAAILLRTEIPRLRLSSLEPWDLSADFFALWDSPNWDKTRLCRHLHLPLQSGCDATLKRMRRNTDQASFAELVRQARAAIPHLGLSTDLIVGFPGEDEAEFSESLAFVEAMNFMKIHVFPYSVREGTPAAKMRAKLDPATIKERVGAMNTLSETGTARFYGAHLGQTMPVLWEQIRGASEDGFWHIGLTDNYIKVEITHPEALTNQLTPTCLNALTGQTMQGIIV